jgi:hypothetical protein
MIGRERYRGGWMPTIEVLLKSSSEVVLARQYERDAAIRRARQRPNS